jgi:putative transposase
MEQLKHGKYYHIYNRGNNGENLFNSSENYLRFLNLYEKYIDTVAETYAWCLMKNHFHLLVRIKEVEEIGYYKLLTSDKPDDPSRFQTIPKPNLSVSEGSVRVNIEKDLPGITKPKTGYHLPINSDRNKDSVGFHQLKQPNPSRHFSHLFNAYSKYYNILNSRTGTLFERPFERKEITSDKYFCNLVVYIHKNPVRHGFTDNYKDYPWSSYGTVLSDEPIKLQYKKLIEWFENVSNYINVHNSLQDFDIIQNLVIDD